MKTLYRTNFEIVHQDSRDVLFDRVAKICWDWIFNPKRRLTCPQVIDRNVAGTVEKVSLATDCEVEAFRLNDPKKNKTAWGLRFAHRQPDDQDIVWTTEVGLISEGSSRPCFSCAVSVAQTGPSLAPIRQPASRPTLIPEILNQFKCVGTFPLLAKPIALNPTQPELSRFSEVVTDANRTRPVILISCVNSLGEPAVDASVIADKLAGLAHTVLATSPQVSVDLTQFIPNRINAYDGAVRLYWPGFQPADQPFDHPLWTQSKIDSYAGDRTDRLAQILLDVIAGTAVYNIHDKVLTWERLQSLARAQAIEEAKSRGETQDLLLLFEEDNKALRAATAQLQAQLNNQGEELKKQTVLVEVLKAALDERKKPQAEQVVDVPATSVQEAIERAAKVHADELSFALNSKSDEASPFQPAQEVEKAFNWLATVYRDAKSGVKQCPDLDHSIRANIPGWSFSGGQKRQSVARYAEWYTTKILANELWLGEHIGCGNSKDPAETIRIAFTWDPSAKKCVVGYVGQHQKNANT